MKVITEQFSYIEQGVQNLIADIPTEVSVNQGKGIRKGSTSLPNFLQPFNYTGEFNADGRPDGIGIAIEKNSSGQIVKITGRFKDGIQDGPVSFETTTSTGALMIQSVSRNLRLVDGPYVRTNIDAAGRRTVHVGSVDGGVITYKRERYDSGTTYIGLYDSKFSPLGTRIGMFPNGTIVHVSVGGAAKYSYNDGSTKKCLQAIVDGRRVCKGPVLYEWPDGRTLLDYENVGGASAIPNPIAYQPKGASVDAYVETCNFPWTRESRVCKRIWENGGSYEGEWNEKGWGEGTRGRYIYLNGAQAIGSFKGRRLVDGIGIGMDGVEVPIGSGVKENPPRVVHVAN